MEACSRSDGLDWPLDHPRPEIRVNWRQVSASVGRSLRSRDCQRTRQFEPCRTLLGRGGDLADGSSSSVLESLDAKPLEMRQMVFHGLQLYDRVSLPIGDFADDPERITGTV